MEGEKIVYRMTPAEFADKVQELIEAGANIVGGCCGTSPDYIRAVCARLATSGRKKARGK